MRDDLIDAARGIGMILVLYGHALEVLFIDRSDHVFSTTAFLQYKLIYSFHMPLFFFLSGMVQPNLSGKTLKQTALRCISLLLIAVMVDEIGLILIYFDRVEPLSDWQLFKWSLRPVLQGFQFSIPVLWFLYTLSVTQFSFWIFLSFRSTIVYCSLAFVMAASFWFSMRPDFPDYFQIKIWVPAFMFFGFGWCLRRFSVRLPLATAVPCVVGLILLFELNQGCPFSFSQSCPVAHLNEHFAVQMIQGDVGNQTLFYVTALTGSLAIVSIAVGLCRLRPLTWVGRNSLEIFIANGFVLEFLNPVLRSMPIPQSPLYPLIFVGVALIINVGAVAALWWPIQLIARAAKIIASAIVQPSRHVPES